MMMAPDGLRRVGRPMAVKDGPAGRLRRARPGGPARRVVVARQGHQFDVRSASHCRKRVEVAGGPPTKSPRLQQVAGDDQPIHDRSIQQGRQPIERLGQRVRRNAIAAASAWPTRSQDGRRRSRRFSRRRDGAPFGGEEPAAGAVKSAGHDAPPASNRAVQPPQGLGRRFEPEASVGPGSIHAVANGDGPSSDRKRTARPARQPGERRRRVEKVVEHFAARLAEQGVVGAGGLHQRIKPPC